MNEFKEMVQADIKEIFLDIEMFGETHTIAGKEMTVIFDDAEKLRRNGLYQDEKAVYSKRQLIYAAAKDIGRLPDIGRRIEIDGKDYKVMQADDEDGMYVIMVEEFKE